MAEQSQLDRIEASVAKVEKVLTGNGEPERGVVMRVAMLEEHEKQCRRFQGKVVKGTYTAMVTALAAIGAVIKNSLKLGG